MAQTQNAAPGVAAADPIMPDAMTSGAVAAPDFTNAMGNAATGVNVVTTDGPGGRFGVTISAMSSLSAAPPSLLACIHRQSPVAAAIAANGAFCVNVLGSAQAALSDIFAGRTPMAPDGEYRHGDRFRLGDWRRLATGAPVLEGAVASFDCRLAEAHAFGTHRMFVGLVIAVREGGGAPLIYHNRAYGRPISPRTPPC